MKNINKNGFTLIELLAVIVVLAIILVITIPTVLGSLSNARKEAFDASANSAAKWYETQYAYCKIGDISAFDKDNYPGNVDCTISDAVLDGIYLKATGLNGNDYDAKVSVYSNGRACVELSVPRRSVDGTGTYDYDGKFKDLGSYVAKSSGCN